MNILVFQRNVWSNQLSGGNTLSNWFEGWKDDSFRYITTRNGVPDNSVAKEYYVISDMDLFRHHLNPDVIGNTHLSDDLSDVLPGVSTGSTGLEGRLVRRFREQPSNIVNLAIANMWRSGKWQNQKLEEFVKAKEPDIFFAFLLNGYILAPMIHYIKRNTRAKVVLFASDEVFEGRHVGILGRRYDRMMTRLLMDSARAADLLYCATPLMSKEYGEMLRMQTKTLYKGCNFDNDISRLPNHPLRMVYAGNLLYGRLETLSILARAINEINANELRLFLDIFTTTPLSEDEAAKLNYPEAAQVHSAVTYEQVKKIMSESDLALHVESFSQQHIRITRLSFSTKISDCLQSGAVLFAIGPKELASIQYSEAIPGAIVVSDLNNVENVLRKIVDESSMLPQRAASIRSFAQENHEIKKVRAELRNDFLSLLIRD